VTIACDRSGRELGIEGWSRIRSRPEAEDTGGRANGEVDATMR
jgi:hypothetical protein